MYYLLFAYIIKDVDFFRLSFFFFWGGGGAGATHNFDSHPPSRSPPSCLYPSLSIYIRGHCHCSIMRHPVPSNNCEIWVTFQPFVFWAPFYTACMPLIWQSGHGRIEYRRQTSIFLSFARWIYSGQVVAWSSSGTMDMKCDLKRSWHAEQSNTFKFNKVCFYS